MKKSKRSTAIRKAAFAKVLHVSKARVSQLVAAGLPTLKDGRIDADQGRRWYEANILRPAALAEVGSAAAPGVPAAQPRPAGRAEPTALTKARTRREQLAGDLLEEEIALRKKRRILPGDAKVISGRLWGAYWETVQMTSLHAANELAGVDGLSWVRIHESIQNHVRYRARGIRQICEGLDALSATALPSAEETQPPAAPGKIEAEGFVPIVEVDQLLVGLIEEIRDTLLRIPAEVPAAAADAVSNTIRRALTRLSQWKGPAEKESNHAKSESTEVPNPQPEA
jgi:hypothetical protein